MSIFILFLIFTFMIFVGIAKTKNHPRFAKVRPVTLSLSTALGVTFYVSGGSIASALQWHCIYIFTAHIMAISLVSTSITMRSLVLALEAQYAKQASADSLQWGNNTADTASFSAPRIQSMSTMSSNTPPSPSKRVEVDSVISERKKAFTRIFNQFKTLCCLWSVWAGRTRLTQLSLSDIVTCKSNYGMFALSFLFPSIVVCLCLAFYTPAVYQCPASVCHDMFLEAHIGLFSVLFYTMCGTLRAIYIAYQSIGYKFDDKGLV